jgi:hypothetical protein
MNIETLAFILVIAVVAAIVSRLLGGFTLSRFLASYLLACFGAIGGWLAQDRLRLPPLYAFQFPVDGTPVPVVWPTLGALLAAILGAWLWRRAPAPHRRRTRR